MAVILAIPVMAWRDRFSGGLAAAVMLLEVLALASTGGAARSPAWPPATPTIGANFDIYLPHWLALNNTLILARCSWTN